MAAMKAGAACGFGGYRAVAIVGMDPDRRLLKGEDGLLYRECEPNTWVATDGPINAVYLGTGRHGGGIVLRVLFVKSEDGSGWVNATTGRPAPANAKLPE